VTANFEFTGKERDAETGLDFFGTRYFQGAQARFTGPDRPFRDQRTADPQRWNLYSYVRNNPMTFVDEKGQELKLATYNSTNLPNKVVTYVAQAIVSKYTQANVKNVTYELPSGTPYWDIPTAQPIS
jgi:RHS repeat-associated protein